MSPWGQCEPGTGQPDTLHSFLKSCELPTKPWTRVLAGLQGASGGQQTPYLELVSKPGPQRNVRGLVVCKLWEPPAPVPARQPEAAGRLRWGGAGIWGQGEQAADKHGS